MAASLGDCVLDVTGLRFMDVASMRAIARSAHTAADGIQLRGASPELRRLWDLCGFADAIPAVQLSP